MRRLTTLISDRFVRRNISPPDPPPPISTVVRERINRVLRRRLSDRVTDVFHEACMSGDLDTAAELLGVLEAMQVRRQAAVVDRRLGTGDLERARDELATRRAEREAAATRSGGVG
ncbi:MAG: hypothetical protein WDN25_24495 [Acetobacteraceae bacterium]